MDAKIHHLFVFYKVDKEKVSDWLLRLPYEGERTDNNPKLDSAAKVIKDFHNPSIEGDKMQNAKMQCVDIDIVSGFCLCVFCKKG